MKVVIILGVAITVLTCLFGHSSFNYQSLFMRMGSLPLTMRSS